MHRFVHIPRHTWHPVPQVPRSWSFCRWLGHGLPQAHLHIIDTLERQRMGLGFVRAYVVDPAPADGTIRTLLSQYVRWLGQATFPLIDPRVVVVDRSARSARHSAKSVPGSRPVSASLADNLRGCPFDIVLMLDAHAYPKRTFAFDTARQALVGAVAHSPGTAVILHGAPTARSHFRAALASAATLYLKILPPPLESVSPSLSSASSPPPAPELAKVPANSLSQKKSDPVRKVRFHPADVRKVRSHPHRHTKAPPVSAVAATAPQPRTLLRTPSSKELIDILAPFPSQAAKVFFKMCS